MGYEVVGLSDIFTKRTILAETEVTSVETPRDALWASLSSHAVIDWGFMSRVSGKPPETLQGELLESGDVFQLPGGGWQTRQEYLSGDVVSKLAEARRAAEQAEINPRRWDKNVEELESVQPEPLRADQITPTLGAHWINSQ